MIRRARTALLRAAGLGAILTLTSGAVADPEQQTPVPTSPSQREDETKGAESRSARARDAKGEVPIVAYAYSAAGAPAKTAGAYGYGLGLAAQGQDTAFGGGVTMWGAPIDRLTLIADLPSDLSGRFTPSLALIGRILGGRREGYALSALGKWKAEGFGVGPHGDEIESELEGGVLFSFADSGFHLDTNALAGFGTGPSGEADVEGRLRLGYDVHRLVFVGLDGQTRVRVAGPQYLPNGRIWDFAAGGQVMVGAEHFFGAFTVGPSTMGLTTDSIGITAMLSAGGAI